MKTTLVLSAAIALQALAADIMDTNQALAGYLDETMLAQEEYDLADGLYNISDESKEFADSIDELEQIWIKVEKQIQYYESLGISYANFVGEWTDIWNSDQVPFYGGDVAIRADGTGAAGDQELTIWWNGWN